MALNRYNICTVSLLFFVSCCLLYVIVDNIRIKREFAALVATNQARSNLNAKTRFSRQADSPISNQLNDVLSAWLTTDSAILPVVRCSARKSDCGVYVANDFEAGRIRNASYLMEQTITQLINSRIDSLFRCSVDSTSTKRCGCPCLQNNSNIEEPIDYDGSGSGIIERPSSTSTVRTTPIVPTLDCGTPPVIPNGRQHVTTSTTIGETVRYECNEGFIMEGSALVSCGEGAIWSTTPNCTAIDCGPPTSISNGHSHSVTSTQIGGTARYSCNVGYNLKGTGLIECHDDGQWRASGLFPYCDIVDCGNPPPIENGRYLYHRTTYGEAADYICDSGYDKGVSRTRCLFDGTWLFRPTCTARRPANPCDSNPCQHNCTPNGSYSYHCTCRYGYALNSDRRTCYYIGYFG